MDNLMLLFQENSPKYQGIGFNEAIDTVRISRTYDQQDGRYNLVQEVMDLDKISRAIEDCPQGTRSPTSWIATIRLAERKSPNYLDISNSSFWSLLDLFGLQDCAKYAHISIHSVAFIPQLQNMSSKDFSCSLFTSHFLGFYTRYDSASNTTWCVCWTYNEFLDLFSTSLKHLLHVSRHPCYHILSIVTASTSYYDANLCNFERIISEVEKRTGYKGWDIVSSLIAKGSLSELSQRMSGVASSAAATKRAIRLVDEMIAIAKDQNASLSLVEASLSSLVVDIIQLTQRRTKSQYIHLDLTTARVNIQLTALFNLRSQQDTQIGLDIASATKRDSSSMKTLAAVTVTFLPGTFIAALFSMSMFDWRTSSEPVVSTRFWVYWAVTLPLTFTVVVGSLVWTYRQELLTSTRSRDKGNKSNGLA